MPLILVTYVLRRLSQSVLLVGSVFGCLFLILGFFDYADGRLSFGQFLPIVVVDSLRLLSHFSVTILFFSFLLTLRSLVIKSQLVAMQAAAVSGRQLVAMMAVASLLIWLSWALLSELVMPFSSQLDRHYRANLNNSQSQLKTSGQWLRSGAYFIRFGEDGQWSQLLQFDQHNRLRIEAKAKSAQWLDEGLLLQQVELNEYHYDHQTSRAELPPNPFSSSSVEMAKITPEWLVGIRVERRKLDDWMVELNLNQQIVDYFNRSVDDFFIWQLGQYLDFLQENNQLNDQRLVYQFWQRLLVPLELFGLVLIFLPSLLGSSRVNKFGRVWSLGIGAGLLVYFANLFLQTATGWLNVSGALLAWSLPFCLLAIGCWRWLRQ